MTVDPQTPEEIRAYLRDGGFSEQVWTWAIQCMRSMAARLDGPMAGGNGEGWQAVIVTSTPVFDGFDELGCWTPEDEEYKVERMNINHAMTHTLNVYAELWAKYMEPVAEAVV